MIKNDYGIASGTEIICTVASNTCRDEYIRVVHLTRSNVGRSVFIVNGCRCSTLRNVSCNCTIKAALLRNVYISLYNIIKSKIQRNVYYNSQVRSNTRRFSYRDYLIESRTCRINFRQIIKSIRMVFKV